MTPGAPPGMGWGASLPPFRVRVSARARRVLLKAVPGEGLVVVLPRGVDESFARLAVERQRAWAEEALSRLVQRGQAPGVPVLPESIHLQAVGRHIPLLLHPGDPRRLSLHRREDALALRGRVEDAAAGVALLRRWLLEEGRRHLVPWCLELSRSTGLPVTKVSIRRQRTRWGSRSTSGNISLSCCLLFLPREQARYVLLHELCHAKAHNHSTQFWDAVAQVEPDWKRLDAALRESWRHVPGWAAG